jgi:hypothetical protein
MKEQVKGVVFFSVFAVIALLIAFLSAGSALADTTIASDGFESGGWSGGNGWSNNWYHVGKSNLRTANSPHSGNYHIRLRGGNDGKITRKVDLSGVSNAHLQFWYKVNSLENGDEALIKIYDGAWHTVMSFENGDDDNTYHQADIDLSSYNMISNFKVRFQMDASGSGDYMYIDDVKMLSGTGSSTPTPTPSGDVSFSCGWETTILGDGCWDEKNQMASYSIQRVTDHVRKGNYSARFEVRPGDDPIGCTGCGERAEVAEMRITSNNLIQEDDDSGTQYYAFSVRFDENWVSPEEDPVDGLWSHFFQLHGPDILETSSAFAMDTLNTSNNEGISVILHTGDLDDPNNSLQWATYELSEGSLNKGNWIDFVIKIKWASDFTGSVDVWRRDEGETDFALVLTINNVPTLQYRESVNGGAVGSHYWKHGFYRPVQPGSVINILWLDGMSRGDTFDAVVGAAFP